MKPELHPACALWPKMNQKQLEELAADIKVKGQLEDITLMRDGRLLDGSNRWDACELAGIIPRTEVYTGDDPIGFVLSKNKLRRHLDIGQLALITAKLVNLKREDGRPKSTSARGASLEQLSKQAGISSSAVERARVVLSRGTPEVIAMVQSGAVQLHDAADALRDNRTPESQAGWTAEDVRREGQKAYNSRPSAQKRRAAPKQPAVPRPTPIKFPTAEETGFPVNGTMAERDAHHRKYGRTPLHPKVVKDMLNNDGMIGGYVAAILSVTNNSHPEPEVLFAALDAMLAWVPQPEKGSDYGINFGRKAKQHLAILHERLPILVERSQKLAAALANWACARES